MNDKRYKWILYTIVTVIVATIAIQIYWNYKNYQTNKQQLINDVQVSLDKAVDDYYTALAERTTVGIFLEGDQQKDLFSEGSKIKQFLSEIDTVKNEFKDLESTDLEDIEGITVLRGFKVDSMVKEKSKTLKPALSIEEFKKRIDSFQKANSDIKLTSAKFNNIELLTSKIVLSIKNDNFDVAEVDSLFNTELVRKNINIKSKLIYTSNGMPELGKATRDMMDSLLIDYVKPFNDYTLSTTSKSTFLPEGKILKLNFTNETQNILKRSLVGILISTLLVLAVISCLFYMLRIIKHQKQLAEVKNDLISNITHEFKTPIATIGVALESISNFNGIDDKEKTKKYINMSSQQLDKLNIMVEKLLETATLDSDNLELKKESIDIIDLLNAITNRYKIQFPEKEFNTSFKIESLMASVDVFHTENAINNILENAVKYGGDLISIDIIPKDKSFDILISDNGNTLTKTNKDRVFEKFYRVPKGNTHDVKGFGIGLYYTKTIIEKHYGSVNLELNKNLTTFKITLPNV
ncbi:sensor histidine kinase [Winogradskyella sp. UBA3174]|uniref:sensor histidine kinase n=1 Tax=Winogradskyella sp. UBA3174 TaxID=1947785 RepID=UPI0025D07AB0|nr:ATP-binding protein [Winogradskyella sp. UBA3174]|tara:strand:- start:19922 stop:21487 length:1566 start_codon:yes stop_codon:yes gene_type:complete